MRVATAWFLSGMLALLGCSGSKKGSVALDAAAPAGGCVVDDSTGADSAIPLQLGAKATGQICPPGDRDFFAINVDPGTNLLDVNLAYPSALTKVTLQVSLLEADGVAQVPGRSPVTRPPTMARARWSRPLPYPSQDRMSCA